MMATKGQPSSYITITAAEVSVADAISYAEIRSAVTHRDKMGFLKLMWTASANTAMLSRRLESLETDRQQLKKQFDSFSLALSELQNAPPKGEDEERQQKRIAVCHELEETLRKAKKKLDELNREIIYYNDYNEDRQIRFRETMSKYHLQLDKLIEEKVDIILSYLKEQGIKTDKPEMELRSALKEALNDPELQEAYIKSAGQIERKSFSEKLKGWFKS